MPIVYKPIKVFQNLFKMILLGGFLFPLKKIKTAFRAALEATNMAYGINSSKGILKLPLAGGYNLVNNTIIVSFSRGSKLKLTNKEIKDLIKLIKF